MAEHILGLAPNGQQARSASVLGEFTRSLDALPVKRALAVVAMATAMPRCRFDIDYEHGPAMDLSHLAKLRSLGRFLAAVALVKAETGDREAAWTCVLRQLRMAEHIRDEPTAMSQLVRRTVLAIAEEGMQQLAEAGPPTARTARALDQLLGRLGDMAPWIRAVHGERLISGEWVFRQPPDEVAEALRIGGITEHLPALTAAEFRALGASYQKAMVRAASQMTPPYPRAKVQLAETMAGIRDLPGQKLIEFLVVLPLTPYCRKAVHCQAMARVARIGLRLKAYRAKHGSYPATLAVLNLADIPADGQKDPFTNRALVYRTEGNGFALYSLGPDAIDNGGKPRQKGDRNSFDVAWRAKQ